MIRLPAENPGAYLLLRLSRIINRLYGMIKSLGNIRIFSEDTSYKLSFFNKFMPEVYTRHTSELYKNCVYCANLVKSGCHSNCLKCAIGTYIHCSPLLPGTIPYKTRHPYIMELPSVPWYYKKTCGSFSRLPLKHYFRNLRVFGDPIGIYNSEILEGLEKGLSAGKKPCHVCASIDYSIYLQCSGQKGFEMHSPCAKIVAELSAVYQKTSIVSSI